MEENKASVADGQRSPAISLRAVVILAVSLLIVVAIAGIVLAGRKPLTAATPSTAQAASVPTALSSVVVVFTSGSEKVPADASPGIARFADTVRTGSSAVRVTARYAAGDTKARDIELAKARVYSLRHAFEANGVKAEQMQVEMLESSSGLLGGPDTDRVEMTLR